MVPWHPQLSVCTEPNPVCLLSFSPNMSSSTALPLSAHRARALLWDQHHLVLSPALLPPQHRAQQVLHCRSTPCLAPPTPITSGLQTHTAAPMPQQRADPSYRNGLLSSCNLSENNNKKNNSNPTPPYTTQSKSKARYPHTPGKAIHLQQVSNCSGAFDHSDALSSHGNGPRKPRVCA